MLRAQSYEDELLRVEASADVVARTVLEWVAGLLAAVPDEEWACNWNWEKPVGLCGAARCGRR